MEVSVWGRTVVALNQEDNFVGDFGEGGILHAQHRVQIFSGLDGLRLRAVRAAEQNPLQKFLHFFSRQRIEQVILAPERIEARISSGVHSSARMQNMVFRPMERVWATNS